MARSANRRRRPSSALLPGPVERVWAYLTDSDLRSKWRASGQMEMKVGAPFEFVWRNSDMKWTPSVRTGWAGS